MLKHQEEYIKLIAEKFGIVGKQKVATYKHHSDIEDSGIIVELKGYISNPRLVFIADNSRNYFHKWRSELNSEHLPRCVWITRYSDSNLSIIDRFFV